MKLDWYKPLIVAACVGALGTGAYVTGQERTTPRTATKQSSDAIYINGCHVNLIDRITVSASRAGNLAFVKPSEGFTVKPDEVVAKVRDEVAAAQFATADKTAKNQVEIKFAQKSAELSQVEWLRAVQSNEVLKGTVTDIELRRLKLAYERAALQTENAEKEHDIAGSKRDEAGEILQTHVVETKLGGMVTKVYKRTGDYVREGDPIIDVCNSDRMRVSGYVPFKDISRVRLGDRVVVRLDIPEISVPEEELRFDGVITFIDVAVQKVKPEVRVFAEVANLNGVLRDGAVAEMILYPSRSPSGMSSVSQKKVVQPPRVVANE